MTSLVSDPVYSPGHESAARTKVKKKTKKQQLLVVVWPDPPATHTLLQGNWRSEAPKKTKTLNKTAQKNRAVSAAVAETRECWCRCCTHSVFVLFWPTIIFTNPHKHGRNKWDDASYRMVPSNSYWCIVLHPWTPSNTSFSFPSIRTFVNVSLIDFLTLKQRIFKKTISLLQIFAFASTHITKCIFFYCRTVADNWVELYFALMSWL